MNVLSGFIKSLSKLSMIGRALMLPISLLPAAGLLLAFGDKFHLPLMMNAGGVIFDNLPLLFAIGSAVGLASESGLPPFLRPCRCLSPTLPSAPY
jgi:PTS system D-glucosamine-specific IIC component